MSRAIAVFGVEPAVGLDNEIRVEGKDSAGEEMNVLVRPVLSGADNGEFQSGLEIRVSCSVSSLDEAFQVGGRAGDALVGMMSCLKDVGIPVVQERIAFLFERSNTRFLQMIRVPGTRISRRNLTQKELGLLFSRLKSLRDQRKIDRILRALRWYRSSILERDTVSKFSMLWIALESLDPLLAEEYATSRQFRSCPSCGAQLEPEGLSGLRTFFQKDEIEGPEFLRKLKNTRRIVFHSTDPILPIMGEMRPMIPRLFKTVKRAVSVLLKDEGILGFVEPQISHTIPNRIGFEGHLSPEGYRFDLDDEVPRLAGPFTITKVRPKKDNTIDVSFKGELKVAGPTGIKMILTGTRFMGEGISHREFQFLHETS